MGILDNSSTYYAKPKHRTYLTMANENYNSVRNAILHNFMHNYVIVQAALSTVFYFKYIIDTFDKNEKNVEKHTEVLRSLNLVTLLHYIDSIMGITIPNVILTKATSLTSYYFALAEATTDTFTATNEEIQLCYKNLIVCKNFALQIIKDLDRSLTKLSNKLPDDIIIFEDKEYIL